MLPSQDKRWLDRYQELFGQADAFLFEGPQMAKQLIRIGCPEKKVHIHHLGVEIDAISYKPRYWQPGEPLRFLIAAAFREKKGIPDAIKALEKIQHLVPVEITIIGDANSERRNIKEKEKIFNILDSSGLLPKTRLLGYQPYSVFMAEAYNHHIFLSPSITASNGDTEGGAPVSIIEMVATGMPVVSTSHCDIPEVIQYGIENWLVEERDVEGLIRQLEWLINNPDDWKKFLSVGRKHVENEFDAIEQGKRLEGIYKSLLN
jgi:colanic acid/amylovoran biosynthesis glycosyltransferase